MKDEIARKQAGTPVFTRRRRPCACRNHFTAVSVSDWCGGRVLSGKRPCSADLFSGRVGKTVCLRRWYGACAGVAAVAPGAVSASAADGIAGERHTDQRVGGMAVHGRCRSCLSAVLGRLGAVCGRLAIVPAGACLQGISLRLRPGRRERRVQTALVLLGILYGILLVVTALQMQICKWL